MSEEWCDVLFWATMMSNKVKSADEEDDHPGSSQRVFQMVYQQKDRGLTVLGNALTCFLDPGSSGEGNTHASTRRRHGSCNLCLAALALNPNAVVFLEQSGKGAFISDPLPLHSCIWDVFPSDLFLSCSFTSFRSM